MKKKVLIITYYWPPAGGPGVQRILKFAKYLPEFGWQPIILTVKNGEYPALDDSLSAEVPEDIKIYRTKTLEFFSLFKKLTGRTRDSKIETYILNKDKQASRKDQLFAWIRHNLFIPDARLGWYWYGLKKGLEIVRKEKPDLIFSSSPPHSLQIIARDLARKSGLPWVADMRDPWTDAFWEQKIKRTYPADRKNKRLEKSVLSEADAVTTVSPGLVEYFQEKVEINNFHVIYNGYDGYDFNYKKEEGDKFRIKYIGHMAPSQNPVNLFKAMTNFPPEMLKNISVDFIGSIDPSVISSIKEWGLKDKIKAHSYIPHDKAVKEIVNAELLLLLIPREHSKGIVPGKLFEYLATSNYILGIGDEKGDSAQMLFTTKAGEIFDYEKDVKDYIIELYELWQQNKMLKAPQQNIDRFSRKQLTSELSLIFNEVI